MKTASSVKYTKEKTTHLLYLQKTILHCKLVNIMKSKYNLIVELNTSKFVDLWTTKKVFLSRPSKIFNFFGGGACLKRRHVHVAVWLRGRVAEINFD